jgi:hypothetical protein
MSGRGDSEQIASFAKARQEFERRVIEFRLELRTHELELHAYRPVDDPVMNKMLAVVDAAFFALNACVETKCTLEGKEPVDIRARPSGPNGDLIQRCDHAPSHCWSYAGTRIDCPA